MSTHTIQPGLKFEMWGFNHTVKERRDEFAWIVRIEEEDRDCVLYDVTLQVILSNPECVLK